MLCDIIFPDYFDITTFPCMKGTFTATALFPHFLQRTHNNDNVITQEEHEKYVSINRKQLFIQYLAPITSVGKHIHVK